MMSKMSPGIIAGLGSLALLLGAFGFQYIGGLAPCVLCLYQRWPHAVGILMAILGMRLKSVALPIMGALSSATSAAIGAYHSGVELGVLKGPTSCSGGVDLSRLSPEEALEAIMRSLARRHGIDCHAENLHGIDAGIYLEPWFAIVIPGDDQDQPTIQGIA